MREIVTLSKQRLVLKKFNVSIAYSLQLLLLDSNETGHLELFLVRYTTEDSFIIDVACMWPKVGKGSETWKPWSLKSGGGGSSLAALEKFTPIKKRYGTFIARRSLSEYLSRALIMIDHVVASVGAHMWIVAKQLIGSACRLGWWVGWGLVWVY